MYLYMVGVGVGGAWLAFSRVGQRGERGVHLGDIVVYARDRCQFSCACSFTSHTAIR